MQVLRRQIDVNLVGSLLCARAAIPLLSATGSGTIIFTSSVQAHQPLPGYAPYGATKAGLIDRPMLRESASN